MFRKFGLSFGVGLSLLLAGAANAQQYNHYTSPTTSCAPTAPTTSSNPTPGGTCSQLTISGENYPLIHLSTSDSYTPFAVNTDPVLRHDPNDTTGATYWLGYSEEMYNPVSYATYATTWEQVEIHLGESTNSGSSFSLATSTLPAAMNVNGINFTEGTLLAVQECSATPCDYRTGNDSRGVGYPASADLGYTDHETVDIALTKAPVGGYYTFFAIHEKYFVNTNSGERPVVSFRMELSRTVDNTSMAATIDNLRLTESDGTVNKDKKVEIVGEAAEAAYNAGQMTWYDPNNAVVALNDLSGGGYYNCQYTSCSSYEPGYASFANPSDVSNCGVFNQPTLYYQSNDQLYVTFWCQVYNGTNPTADSKIVSYLVTPPSGATLQSALPDTWTWTYVGTLASSTDAANILGCYGTTSGYCNVGSDSNSVTVGEPDISADAAGNLYMMFSPTALSPGGDGLYAHFGCAMVGINFNNSSTSGPGTMAPTTNWGGTTYSNVKTVGVATMMPRTDLSVSAVPFGGGTHITLNSNPIGPAACTYDAYSHSETSGPGVLQTIRFNDNGSGGTGTLFDYIGLTGVVW